MNLDGMEFMEWEEEANPYMEWLEVELIEMNVDRNIIDVVMGAEQQDLQIVVVENAVGMEDGDKEAKRMDVVNAMDIIKYCPDPDNLPVLPVAHLWPGTSKHYQFNTKKEMDQSQTRIPLSQISMGSVWTNESRAFPDNIVIADMETFNINISASVDLDPVADIRKVETVGTDDGWNTVGGGGFISLELEDTQEVVGTSAPKRRRLSGRVEELVLRIEGGVEERKVPLTEPKQTKLQKESRREEGVIGGGRKVMKLVGRFGGEQSKITSYFGRGGVGGGLLENSGMERGPLQHTTAVLRDNTNKRKAETDDRGSVGSKRGRW